MALNARLKRGCARKLEYGRKCLLNLLLCCRIASDNVVCFIISSVPELYMYWVRVISDVK